MDTDTQTDALEGRSPVLPDERLFANARTFLASCIVFGAAVWIFMVGAGLAALGDLRLVIPGYLIGLLVGFAPVMLSTGLPAFRYGIDPMDAAKATFGTRGAVVPLIGLLYVALTWSTVLTAFIAQGLVTVAQIETGRQLPGPSEAAIAIALAVAVWLLVRRGPAALERINNWIGPSLIALATILLVLLVSRDGWGILWTGAPPAAGWMFHDRPLALLSAIELGIGSSLGSWPFLGGMTRLVRRRRDVVTPALLGTTLIGLGYGASVSAVVARAMPSADPISWFIALGGPIVGGVAVVAMLLANIAVIGLFLYFSAVAAQQIGWMNRLRWSTIVALLLVPVTIGAFFPGLVLSAVLTINNYQAMIFTGMAGVTLANYYGVLRQRLDLTSVFARHGEGAYAGHGGICWPALLSAGIGSAVYRLLYDPLTLMPNAGFHFVGASVPGLVAAAISFLLLRRLLPAPHTLPVMGPNL